MKTTIQARMAKVHPAYGELALCHLGQHSFILKFGETVVYADLFLSPLKRRLIPPAFAPEAVTDAAIFAGTHDHGDHIDRPVWPALAAASPGAKFVVPEAVRASVLQTTGLAAERVLGLNDGGRIEIGGVTIRAVAVGHELLDYDPKTGLYPYLGYLFEGNGVTVFHAGDCCNYEGLLTKLRQWKIDVALLPINGRDAWRFTHDCIGNMTYQEAADLAGALQPQLTIPAHYDMFPGNTVDPKLFLDYMRVKYPQLACACPPLGTLWRRQFRAI